MAHLKNQLPPVNALVVFEAAARHLNFSRASDELRVVQPAVTRQIRNLEQDLQVSLFARNNNKLTLTVEGEKFYRLVQDSLHKIASMSAALRGSESNKLVIGSTFAFANLWLAPRLPALRKALPDTHLNLLISEQYEDFGTGATDVSIRFGDGHWPGMTAHLLFAEEVYPIAARTMATLEHWETVPLLDQPNDARDLNWMTWPQWQSKTGSAQFDECDRLNFDSYLYVLDAVRNGEGVALGMTGLTDEFEAAHNLVQVGPRVRRERAGYYLVHPEWYPNDRMLKVLISVLRRV